MSKFVEKPRSMEYARAVAHVIILSDTDRKLAGAILAMRKELLRRQQARASVKYTIARTKAAD